jgi:predicted nucleotidyltransferase
MEHLQKNTLSRLSRLTPEERDAVLEFVKRLKALFGPSIQEIILFGSKARKQSESNSDIDILIVLDKISIQIKKAISELAAEQNIKHNVLISTIRYDTATWENPAIRASPFGQAVKHEGIWL